MVLPFTFTLSRFSLVDRYNGPVGEHKRVTPMTMLPFTWYLDADDFKEECDVQLLCCDVARRSVHVPSVLKNLVPAADALARTAVQRARGELSLSDVTKLDCRQSLTNPAYKYKHACTHIRAPWGEAGKGITI